MCLDAKLMYFNDRYNIALLYIDLNVTLELPSIGCHPQYGEEVFVLARDGGASLRVRRGNIKWLEESGFLGRDHYMFLSSAIPLNIPSWSITIPPLPPCIKEIRHN